MQPRQMSACQTRQCLPAASLHPCRAARETAKAQRAQQDIAAKAARLEEYKAQQAREQEARVSCGSSR